MFPLRIITEQQRVKKMKREEIPRKDSIIIYFVFGILMLLLIGFVLFTMLQGPSKNELVVMDNLSDGLILCILMKGIIMLRQLY